MRSLRASIAPHLTGGYLRNSDEAMYDLICAPAEEQFQDVYITVFVEILRDLP